MKKMEKRYIILYTSIMFRKKWEKYVDDIKNKLNVKIKIEESV